MVWQLHVTASQAEQQLDLHDHVDGEFTGGLVDVTGRIEPLSVVQHLLHVGLLGARPGGVHTCMKMSYYIICIKNSGKGGGHYPLKGGPPRPQQLVRHTQSVVQQAGVQIGHLLDQELHKATQHVLAPVGKVDDEVLQGMAGQSVDLVGVHRQSGRRLHQVRAADMPSGMSRGMAVITVRNRSSKGLASSASALTPAELFFIRNLQ